MLEIWKLRAMDSFRQTHPEQKGSLKRWKPVIQGDSDTTRSEWRKAEEAGGIMRAVQETATETGELTGGEETTCGISEQLRFSWISRTAN